MATPPAAGDAQLESEVQEDLMRLDAYRNQLNSMLQQFQILSASRTEHLRARESLEGVERTSGGAEMLLPLGGETYVRGSVDREAAVLIGIGSGIVVEMERPKASELLAQRLVRIDQAIRETEGQMAALDDRIQALSRRLDQIARADAAGSHVGRN